MLLLSWKCLNTLVIFTQGSNDNLYVIAFAQGFASKKGGVLLL